MQNPIVQVQIFPQSDCFLAIELDFNRALLGFVKAQQRADERALARS